MEPQCRSAPMTFAKFDASHADQSLGASPSPSRQVSHSNSQETIKKVTEILKTSNNVTENKYQCTITSERLTQLKKIVDEALKDHRIFTIRGGWQTLRKAFLDRKWIEKYEPQNAKRTTQLGSCGNLEDLCNDLPNKQSWETPTAHKEKCERMIMSRMLQVHQVDFFWNMRKDQNDWHHRVQTGKLINRFSRSLFTSKEGLCLLLQQMYWHNEPGIAAVNFPRCYVLGFPEHFNNFVDDFRITACISLMKWFVEKFENSDDSIHSPEGKVSLTAIKFALNRCDDYIASRKHLDIDRNFSKVWDHEWDQFLSQFYQIVHQKELFLYNKDYSLPLLYASVKSTLAEVAKFLPQIHLDGMKNIWILKPGNKCRGRGIQLIRTVEDVMKIMNLKLKYVVQKYIEKPLIIYQTKFDIRQWFLLTSTQPLQIWMYHSSVFHRESYLRFSSQIFSLDNFHESLHLTNHAVQCKYANVNQRDKSLPDENMWDCHTFKAYLKKIGHYDKWDKVIFPGMRQCIIGAMLACQDTMDRRPNTFELYGADFMLAEDFTPWLLEINSSPDLSPSTSVTARMCPQCLEDIVKVIIDKRRNPKAETGMFELVFKQNLPRAPAYLGMTLSVRGRKLFRNTSKHKKLREKENEKSIPNADILPNYITTMLKKDVYQGPVIHDLIDEIQKTYTLDVDGGVNFVPAQPVSAKKKKIQQNKSERVSKCESCTIKTKLNRKCFSIRNPSGSETSKRQAVGSRSGLGRVWERDTTSILKGKNIYKFNGNKNDNTKTPRCLSSLSLNQILPRLNSGGNNSTGMGVSKDFLTVGTGFSRRSLRSVVLPKPNRRI